MPHLTRHTFCHSPYDSARHVLHNGQTCTHAHTHTNTYARWHNTPSSCAHYRYLHLLHAFFSTFCDCFNVLTADENDMDRSIRGLMPKEISTVSGLTLHSASDVLDKIKIGLACVPATNPKYTIQLINNRQHSQTHVHCLSSAGMANSTAAGHSSFFLLLRSRNLCEKGSIQTRDKQP